MHEEPNKLLKRAVSEITFNMNVNKMTPHDAVVKVAKELDLNVHFIKRASEAVNVALTHYHFKKHAEARDEDFPIVDAEKVFTEVFSKPIKTASEKKSEWFSTVDVTDEVPDFNKLLANKQVKKAYETIVINPEKHDSFDVSEKGKHEKIAKLQDKMERELNDIATKRAGVKFDLNHNFVNLVNQFSRDEAYRSSFTEFEKQSLALYGDRAVPYIDLVYKSAGVKEERAVADKTYSDFTTCKEAAMLGNLLKSASELVETEKLHADRTLSYLHLRQNIKLAYQEMCKQEEEIKQAAEIDIITKKAEPEVDPAVLDPVLKLAQEKLAAAKKEAQEKEAAFKAELDKKAFDMLSPAFDIAKDKFKGESTPRMTVPSTSYQDNLERKLLLERMLVTDPILSTADPKRVVDAYEQFLHLAPEMSKEPEVVKGALRNMVASQSLDPHTAQQFVEANSSYANQKMQQQGVPKK